jgi:hypothetical protein
MFGLISKLLDLSSPGKTLIERSLIVFTDTLGGSGFPENGDDEPEDEYDGKFNKRVPLWIHYLGVMIFTNFVTLNTLIAIIGDAYDKVMSDLQRYEAETKI